VNDDDLRQLFAETRAAIERVDVKVDVMGSRLDERADRLDARFDGLDARFDGLDSRVDAIDAKVDRVDAKVDRVDAKVDRVDAKVDRVDAKVDDRFDDALRHFDVTAEKLQSHIMLVAEAVKVVAEDLVRTRTALDEKIDHTTAETQAMIRFSHAELSKRVEALEHGSAN
jgi:chromosome segregation ATPase